MLVLSRNVGEVVIITIPGGQTIEVHLTQTSRGRAKIGFQCNRQIRIDRLENIDPENRPQPLDKNLVKT